MKTLFPPWRIFLPDLHAYSLSLLTVACSSGKADPQRRSAAQGCRRAGPRCQQFQGRSSRPFPLVIAVEHKALSALNVTGVVQPDIMRAVPVVSLASGRVVEIKARLGDPVKKGQLLLRVQSNDVSGAYQNYFKAENDERLARITTGARADSL